MNVHQVFPRRPPLCTRSASMRFLLVHSTSHGGVVRYRTRRCRHRDSVRRQESVHVRAHDAQGTANPDRRQAAVPDVPVHSDLVNLQILRDLCGCHRVPGRGPGRHGRATPRRLFEICRNSVFGYYNGPAAIPASITHSSTQEFARAAVCWRQTSECVFGFRRLSGPQPGVEGITQPIPKQVERQHGYKNKSSRNEHPRKLGEIRNRERGLQEAPPTGHGLLNA